LRASVSTRSSGFTLIELLVALVLLSLVFMMLTSALGFTTRVWSGEEKSSDLEQVVAVQNLLRRVLSEARPLMVESTPSERRHIFFDGDETSVRFIAPMPDHLGVGGLYEVFVHGVEDEGSGGRLEMSWRLFRDAGVSTSPVAAGQRVTLLKDVGDVQFAYFGYQGTRTTGKWYGAWGGVENLPDRIRLRVSFADHDQIWPELLVATVVRSMKVVIDPEHLF
jgi:general secretion pathway protein J